MMQNSLPFPRGGTLAGGDAATITTNLTHTDATSILGKTWVIEDINWAATSPPGSKPRRSGRDVRVMAVRNVSGATLLPKRVAKMKVDGSSLEFLGQISGYATTVGELCYPIDEFLPSTGVLANDIFYLVVGGPATVTTGAAGDTNISIGSFVIPTTDGKVIDQDVTVAAGAATFNQNQGAVGRAIQAVNAINTDFLIDVIPKVG
jgi:hypothetical protein